MNMKKVLAAVLAVMMAVSAMAITAFADDYKIPLYKANDNVVGGYTYTYTLTIPVYATYGYFTEGAYFELTNLPTAQVLNGTPGWGSPATDITWTVNGYKLQKNATTAKVYFGHVAHDFISDELPTVIPVDTVVNGTTTITLTASITSGSQWNWAVTNSDQLKALKTAVQFYNANGTVIPGSASTIAYWNPTASGADASYSVNMQFVNGVGYTDVITGGHWETVTEVVKTAVDKNADGKIDDADKVVVGTEVTYDYEYEYKTSNVTEDCTVYISKVSGNSFAVTSTGEVYAVTNGTVGDKVENPVMENLEATNMSIPVTYPVTANEKSPVDKNNDGIVGELDKVVATEKYVYDYEYTEETVTTDKWVTGKTGLNGAIDWDWDHTLANKAAILGAETAQVVVELDRAINGRAVYTLWAIDESRANYETNENWWAYSDSRILVDTVYVDGSVNELVFDVDLDVLYDAGYGVWNSKFAITEEITLTSDIMEKDATSKGYLVDVDDALWGVGTFPDSSSDGDLTWSRYGGGLKYKGNSIVYAAGGQAHGENGNLDIPSWSGDYAKYHGAEATDIYLVLTSSSDDAVIEDVEEPVEPSTEEEEDETVPAETPEEPEETNPDTGLALALVPMMVAAVAVVASKRR